MRPPGGAAAAACALGLLLLGVLAGPARTAFADPEGLSGFREGVETGHEYRIQARLDAKRHTVKGVEWIRWRNQSSAPVRELFFHLYLNAFAHNATVFMQERGCELRGRKFGAPGRIDVLSLRTADGEDLLARAQTELGPCEAAQGPGTGQTARAAQPPPRYGAAACGVGDSRKGDATQMLVPLSKPVPPGAHVDLVVRFRSQLPQLVVRSGYYRDFHMVAQWYPKLARLEPNGQWASFPYHGMGEFYADFARYELTVDVPQHYVVGASGQHIATRNEGGRRIHRFVADPVHDVAWCAYPHFRETWLHASRESPGPKVRILAPPGYEAAVARHALTVRAGLRHFGRMFGPYPYPTLTVVVPPRGAEGAAGMEYPTLFVTAGPWFSSLLSWLYWLPGVAWQNARLPYPIHEEVTAHELAHQWFQGLIANDEVTWPVLDEGLAQWATHELLRGLFPGQRSGLAIGGIAVDNFELARTFFLWTGPEPPPSTWPAHAYSPNGLVKAVYLRPALVLETIRRVWGASRLERALKLYAQRGRFRHPQMDALLAAFDEVYWTGFSDQVLKPALEGETSFDARLVHLEVRRKKGKWRASLTAERTGNTVMPTSVAVWEKSGKLARLRWPAGNRLLRATHEGESEIVGALVDPDRSNLLDSSMLDNVKTAPAGGDDKPLFSQILFWAQWLLELLGP